MKRTDDFLADLELQLGAAAAGALPRRRRIPGVALLRPALALAVTAAAVTAFVLAAGTGIEKEHAADPPTAPGGELITPPAAVASSECATLDETTEAGPPAELIGLLSILRRPQGRDDRLPMGDLTVPVTGLDPRAVRRALADLEVTLVPSGGVVPKACTENERRAAASEGPGVCAVVEIEQPRTACWTLTQITGERAVAVLADGIAIALLPDGVREVTFDTGSERDTYPVTDNVVIANVEGLRAGQPVRLTTGAPKSEACGDLVVAEGGLPSELRVAIPLLATDEDREAVPDEVTDLLREAGAARAWLGDARRLALGTDALDVRAWLVPVADSRFSECGEGTVDAPRSFEGPGACIVGTIGDDVRGAYCADLDEFGGVSALDAPGGGRMLMGFLPHGVHIVEVGGEAVLGGVEPARGADVAMIDGRGSLDFVYRGYPERIDPAAFRTNRVAVIGSDPALAADVRERLDREGVETGQLGDHPAVARSTIYYAAGMAPSAGQIGELLRTHDVRPLDEATAARAEAKADVIVVAGDDLRR